MKTAFPLLLSLLPIACSAPGSSAPTEAVHVDAMASTLEEWRARWERCEAADGDCMPQFTEWSEVDTAPLRRLFPTYRFFTISWDQRPVDSTKPRARSYALNLAVTLAVARDTHRVTEFSHYGDYEPFGELLRRERIRISDDAAARLVWDAFCDIHQKRWTDQGIERVSPTLWHLGVTNIGRSRYFYEVVIDADGLIQSGELHSVDI